VRYIFGVYRGVYCFLQGFFEKHSQYFPETVRIDMQNIVRSSLSLHSFLIGSYSERGGGRFVSINPFKLKSRLQNRMSQIVGFLIELT